MIVAMNQNAPGRNPNKVITKLFEILFSFAEMEGTLAWESVDHTSLTVEFALDGSRRYNRFRSPWQFA